MAHTVSKKIFCEEEHKWIECEVMIIDADEIVPSTDRREVVLSCTGCGAPYNELSDTFAADIDDQFPETQLIDQYEGFDNRSGD